MINMEWTYFSSCSRTENCSDIKYDKERCKKIPPNVFNLFIFGCVWKWSNKNNASDCELNFSPKSLFIPANFAYFILLCVPNEADVLWWFKHTEWRIRLNPANGKQSCQTWLLDAELSISEQQTNNSQRTGGWGLLRSGLHSNAFRL